MTFPHPPLSVELAPGASNRVELIRWPAESGRRIVCGRSGVPCLLLVPPGVQPPTIGRLEDWIRVPADERDLYLRLRHLARRSAPEPVPPVVDEFDVVRRDESWAALSPSESVLVRGLLADFGRLATRDEINRWLAEAEGGPLPFPSSLARLRQRLASVGLALHTVRARGYLVMDADDFDAGDGTAASAQGRQQPW
jgi:hypothetical protein